MTYQEVLHDVSGRGRPPKKFLDGLIVWARKEDASVFAPNDNPDDIYARMRGELGPAKGPWTDPLDRQAAMCEGLRVLAGLEASWNYNEGVDVTNRSSQRNIEGQETGIFQVSHDSLKLDKTGGLRRFVRGYLGTDDVQEFIDQMKFDHLFAYAYVARLLRVSVRWDGPIIRQEWDARLWLPAKDEFKRLLVA